MSSRRCTGLVHNEGDCQYGYRTLWQGDIVYDGDPLEEHDMFTEAGCAMLFVQYLGPATGGRPIYQGRFDKRVDTTDADMRLEK